MPENLKEFLFMRLPGSEDNSSPLRFTRKLELFLVICHKRSEDADILTRVRDQRRTRMSSTQVASRSSHFNR